MPAALQIGMALNAITARMTDPLAAAVVSLTVFEAGTATNVIPETIRLAGTVRTLDDAVRRTIAAQIERIAKHTAEASGVTAETVYEFGYPVTVNDPDETAFAVRVAAEVVGDANVEADRPSEMGAEDFSYMLEQRPGAYVFLGTGPGAGLHHPEFDYNDEASPFGASWFVRLVETAQPLQR